MARTNFPVYQVLVTKDTAPLITAGKNPMELTPGQLGIFNYDSGLSVDYADENTMRRVFLAVGRDNTGNGVTDEVVKSTGEYIEVKRIHHASIECPQECEEQILQIAPANIKGETFYTLKLSFFNDSLAMTHGFNIPSKTYVVKTGCCDTTEVCGCDDITICSKLVYDLAAAINLDSANSGVTAILWDVDNNAAVDADDYEEWVEDSANDGCLALRLITSCEAIKSFCSVNLNYKKLRALKLTVAFKEADSNISAATITEIQAISYPEGQGYDIRQMEFEAGGWNAKAGPYHQYELAGGFLGNYNYQADNNEDYIQLVIGHDAMSVSGFEKYINDMKTIIAIPCSDREVIFGETGLGYMIDAMFVANNLNIYIEFPDAVCCGESESSSVSSSSSSS